MINVIEHADGRLMVTETAGGTGGGATSAATRAASFEEIKDHLEERMRHLESQFEAVRKRYMRHVGIAPAPVEHETAVYQDGATASGPGPLPLLSPDEQALVTVDTAGQSGPGKADALAGGRAGTDESGASSVGEAASLSASP